MVLAHGVTRPDSFISSDAVSVRRYPLQLLAGEFLITDWIATVGFVDDGGDPFGGREFASASCVCTLLGRYALGRGLRRVARNAPRPPAVECGLEIGKKSQEQVLSRSPHLRSPTFVFLRPPFASFLAATRPTGPSSTFSRPLSARAAAPLWLAASQRTRSRPGAPVIQGHRRFWAAAPRDGPVTAGSRTAGSAARRTGLRPRPGADVSAHASRSRTVHRLPRRDASAWRCCEGAGRAWHVLRRGCPAATLPICDPSGPGSPPAGIGQRRWETFRGPTAAECAPKMYAPQSTICPPRPP